MQSFQKLVLLMSKGKQQFTADSFLCILDDGVGRPGCYLVFSLAQREEGQKQQIARGNKDHLPDFPAFNYFILC